MRRRILNFGIAAKSDSIMDLSYFYDAVSISDYDAFIFDPISFGGLSFAGPLFFRRQTEIRELVERKGGIVVCVLRPSQLLDFGTGSRTTAYNLLDGISPKVNPGILDSIRPGEGSQIKLISKATGVLSGYLRVLYDKLRFSSYFGVDPASMENSEGTVFAVNSVGYPIAVDFSLAPGRLCFVPIAHGVEEERIGAAFCQIVAAHFGGPGEIEPPIWAKDVIVPGSTVHDARIKELEKQRDQSATEISVLNSKRRALLSLRQLLFGYGTSILEPVVRAAFKLLGFEVPEQDTYAGEWDVELHDLPSGITAIGEVEGSGGPIDVDKFRQLLNYYQNEILEGRKHKGILIGNGYRLTEPTSPERQRQFSQHALNGATANGFCLLPTTELFKAVCQVLENPENEPQKIESRESILRKEGVWEFRRQMAASSSAAIGPASTS